MNTYIKRKYKYYTPKTPEEAFDESVEYYKNARDILKKIPVEYGIYKNPKLVKEACAMGYLATLKAIDGYILGRKEPAKLPTSIIEYYKAVDKIPRNGKLMTALELVYQHLHIFGYYRGGISVEMIKEGFENAKTIIKTLSGRHL